jgi:hypothetical protein
LLFSGAGEQVIDYCLNLSVNQGATDLERTTMADDDDDGGHTRWTVTLRGALLSEWLDYQEKMEVKHGLNLANPIIIERLAKKFHDLHASLAATSGGGPSAFGGAAVSGSGRSRKQHNGDGDSDDEDDNRFDVDDDDDRNDFAASFSAKMHARLDHDGEHVETRLKKRSKALHK